ncbi:hypothetical protein I0C86_35040 [Plantactinospora sp. S1510]|uniref:Asp23/Gls24 family envelope stress response protein n=1 Tax=Plantactinospora alkalitolerans TaxID=2789879 RepID=A0ABS0H6M7_9ACTN|nr:hypothetical protein [Plantactinospora alkalitolerans]MBF9134117.1 hypothetical protein [Plantactinospora alkalitolerans]
MSRRAGAGSTAKGSRTATATRSPTDRAGREQEQQVGHGQERPAGYERPAGHEQEQRGGEEQEQRADPATVAAAVAAAVLAVPGVTRLTPGTGVEVATQFPGGKITGVRLGDPVEVHVEVDPVPIAPVAEQIRNAVRKVLDGFGRRLSVEVVVEDIDLPVPATAMAGS